MAAFVVGKGTLLNTATVLVGGAIGLLVGKGLPSDVQDVVISGLGLVTFGMGVKTFLASRNVLIVAGAIALGGLIGVSLHLQQGVVAFGEWAKSVFGGGDSTTFAQGVVTTSILFCVGPMTLMGCLQEAVENKTDLINLKSTLDGVGAALFAAVLGPGVLVSALVVFVVQGALTILASRLKGLSTNEALLAEANAVGGPILMAIAIGLLKLRDFPTADYIPALAVAPAIVWAQQRWANRSAPEIPS